MVYFSKAFFEFYPLDLAYKQLCNKNQKKCKLFSQVDYFADFPFHANFRIR